MVSYVGIVIFLEQSANELLMLQLMLLLLLVITTIF